LKAGINEKGLTVTSSTAGSLPKAQRDEPDRTKGLLAKLLHLLGVGLIQRQHAAFALNQLHHDRADGAAHAGGFYACNVVRLRVDKPVGKGEEILMKHILSRRGERCDRAPVEGVVQGDDLVSARAVFVERVFAREFDRALVCLRAGVREEHALHAGALDQRLRGSCRRLGIVKVRHMRELLRLLCDRGEPRFVAAAEGADADAAREIDIRLTVEILQRRVFAAFERDRETLISAKDVVVSLLDHVVIGHLFSFLRCHRSAVDW